MNIDKKTTLELQKYIDLARRSQTYEFECKIRNIDDKKTVDNMTLYLLGQKYSHQTIQELDIIYDKNLRSSIPHVGTKISDYCKNNRLPTDAVTIQKLPVDGVSVTQLEEYDVAFKMRNERRTVTEPSKHDRANEKLFRFKKRHSFISENTPYLRVDITAVKSRKSNTMIASGVIDDTQRYEVEVELLQNQVDSSTPTSKILQSLLDLVSKLLMIKQQSSALMTKSERLDVLKSYIRLVSPSVSLTSMGKENGKKAKNGKYTKSEIPLEVIMRNPKSWFIGPQPVTLEQENMVLGAEKEMGVFTIYEDYTVTDKADGERGMLYIPKDIDTRRSVYLISTKLDIIKFPARIDGDDDDGNGDGEDETTFKLAAKIPKDSLLDGEYVTRSTTGQRIGLFAAFDVYFVNGEDIRKKSLRERLSYGKDITAYFVKPTTSNLLADPQGLFLKMKHFEFTSETQDIHECCRRVLLRKDANEYIYHIDGVIFTPQNTAVYGLYPGQTVDYTSIHGMTPWKRVFKWKPPQENTIDFLVKIQKDFIDESSESVPVILYVGYNPDFHDDVNISQTLSELDKTEGTNETRQTKERRYTVYQFAVSRFRVRNGMVVDESNKTIGDNTIVECRFDKLQNVWVPMRTRYDKTKLFTTTGSVSGAANDLRTAQSVLRTINKPVEEKYLLDQNASLKFFTLALFSSNMEDEYYTSQDNMQRNMSLIIRLRKFHNETIKESLLIAECAKRILNEQGHSNYPLSLYDVACGKGGDLLKWARAGFTIAIGSDISRDNILNQRDGAYARLKSSMQKRLVPKKSKYAFLQMDVTIPWDAEYIGSLDNKDGNRDIAQCLWDMASPAELEASMIPEKYRGLLLNKVDVVSCQFAIHYFFKDETTVHNFMKNITSMIKKGGYFIATGLDGATVSSRLRESPIIRGETTENVLIWEIEKKYNDEELLNQKYGQAIQVYVQSLGAKKIEYLVRFDVLRELMEQYGFRLVENWSNSTTLLSTGMFSEVKGFSGLSLPEQEYSKLHRWYAFQYHGV